MPSSQGFAIHLNKIADSARAMARNLARKTRDSRQRVQT